LSDEACRYVLADEVGLGKTIEASVILKGLLRRHAGLKTLVVVPASLTQQWFNELNGKFWFQFAQWCKLEGRQPPADGPELIVSSEELLEDKSLWLWLMMQEWGLVIVDEAHHLHKKPRLYERLLELSGEAARLLILSATPIQRRAEEFLALLKLMNPARYEPITLQQFRLILEAQQMIRSMVADLAIDLNQEHFDPEVFEEDIEEVVEALEHDTLLGELVAQVTEQAESRDRGLKAAQDAIAYISENFRIESRVIRNRRATLQIELPTRAVETSYSYEPETLETEVIDTLHDYVDELIEQAGSDPTAVEYGRVLLHAAFSSPYVLYELLEKRSQSLSTAVRPQTDEATALLNLLSPAAPRQEAERIGNSFKVCHLLPITDERELLSNLLWLTEQWREQTKVALDKLPYSGIRES
jgi:ERCC4-related helicase